MNEGRTTAIFGALAAVAIGVAWWSRPTSITTEAEAGASRVAEDVFVGFEDPDAAASMQIVKYDEALAQLSRFEVARDKSSKLWKLPSNDDYPADAAEQVRDATTALVGLKVLSVQTNDRGDHEIYGVLNPDDGDLIVGRSGVGMLVVFKDQANAVLASLIIGKEIAQRDGQRYVRIPSEDAVYTVELDTAVFKTNFRDWIEGELLGVRSFDITKVAVHDYVLQQASISSMAIALNFDAQVSYDPSANKWGLDSYLSHETAVPTELSLAADEELNTEFLNNLRTAVQDLEIINVQRKPKGLASDLKADETLLKNKESVASLQTQGFFPAGGPNGTEIYAMGGETIVGTNDGVEYLLRFGEATASMNTDESSDADAAGAISRYLLVTARLDESKFPTPDLEPLPETIEEMLAREKALAAPSVSEPAPLEAQPGETPAKLPAEDTTEAELPIENPLRSAPVSEPSTERPPSPKVPASGARENASSTEAKVTEDPAKETPATDEPPKLQEPEADPEPQENPATQEPAKVEVGEQPPVETQTPEASSPAAQEPATEAKPEAKPEATAPAAEPQAPKVEGPKVESPKVETQEELQERLEAVREQIAKENQRKIDQRNEKMDAARKKVQELNARFADWYYVVSDNVYKKLKVTREDLIKKAGTGNSTAPPPGMPNGLPPGFGGFQLPQQP